VQREIGNTKSRHNGRKPEESSYWQFIKKRDTEPSSDGYAQKRREENLLDGHIPWNTARPVKDPLKKAGSNDQ